MSKLNLNNQSETILIILNLVRKLHLILNILSIIIQIINIKYNFQMYKNINTLQ